MDPIFPLVFLYLQDYVATRWYRAPELCGSFFSKVYSYMLCSYHFLLQEIGNMSGTWFIFIASTACVDFCAHTVTSICITRVQFINLCMYDVFSCLFSLFSM